MLAAWGIKLHRLGTTAKKRMLAGALAPAAIGAIVMSATTATWAADSPSSSSSTPPLPQAIKTATDIGGQRTALETKGLRFTFTYYGDRCRRTG